MRANIDTVLVGDQVVLVPYQADHVARYHEWMLSEELRTLTASEPLTLAEEYAMQEKWREDEDKLTFIVLARTPDVEIPTDLRPTDPWVSALPMIGDVNMFFRGTPSTTPNDAEDDDPFEAEVEVMIAEPAYRRQGLALESLRLLLAYATAQPALWGWRPEVSHVPLSPPLPPLPVPPTTLVAKITESNTPSIALFERLGFVVVKRVEVFQEVEMRWVGATR